MDMNEFKKEFDALVEQNNRMQWLKEKYIEHAKDLIEISQDAKKLAENIENIARKIDPDMGHSFVKDKRIKMKEYIDEIYNIMKSGTQITSDFICKTYPVLNTKQVNYVTEVLKKLPSVNKVKDGRTLRLYI
jgi:hypothetical protein